MKLFNLAIASMVDANTGHGVNRNFIEQFASTTSDYQQRAHEIRANFIIAVFGKIKASVTQYFKDSKARAQDRKDTEAILQMSDQILDDIGLSHADLHELRSGQVTLEALGSRRELRRNEALDNQLSQSSGSVSSNLRNIQSANQALFELKKCA